MEPPTPEPEPVASTPTPAGNPLAREFGCQWIMDTYRPASQFGRDTAIQHVANSMMLKRGSGFVGSGDAAAAVRECE